MKFKVDDKVRVIASVEVLEQQGIPREKAEKLVGHNGTINLEPIPGTLPYSVEFFLYGDTWWFNECDLELVSQQAEPQAASVELPIIRTFETGATRDTVAGKLSYMKALSPEVLEAYVMYLDKHRKQPDGSMREFDNWKRGIDKQTYLDSLLRHNMAVWMRSLGYVVLDNHGPVTLLDSLMAVIFNASGLAYELLIEEGKAKRQGVKNESL